MDISNFRIAKENINDAIDLSTKAAVLQIDTDPFKISHGIFEIDDVKAKDAFITVMSKNTDLSRADIISCMYEYKAINTPGSYFNPADGKLYTISNPTFVAPMKFKFKGMLLSKDIVLNNNFGASQLQSIGN